MEKKTIKHGTHRINDDTTGYMYSFNSSTSYDFASHIHNCYEFIHVCEGQLLYNVEGTEYLLSDGDFIMTAPDELHSFSFPKKCEYIREFLHIYPGFLDMFPELRESLNVRRPGYFNRISKELSQKYGITEIFEGIRKYCSVPSCDTDFMVFTYTLQLITIINQILRDETPAKQKVVANKKTNIICSYIDQHYKENITLIDIANAAYMSTAYTSRLFKKEMGMTVKSYLNLRRITHAKSRILQGEKATNIFFECGFSDYSTFYRSFVKYVGMTPEDFKNKSAKPE